MNYHEIVLASYPKAICRSISYPDGTYYMIYDMAPVAPVLLGIDMHSEKNAWKFAAAYIGVEMLRMLEK